MRNENGARSLLLADQGKDPFVFCFVFVFVLILGKRT